MQDNACTEGQLHWYIRIQTMVLRKYIINVAADVYIYYLSQIGIYASNEFGDTLHSQEAVMGY